MAPPKALPIILALMLPILYSLFVAPLIAASGNPDVNVKSITVRVTSFDSGSVVGPSFIAFINSLKSSGAALPNFDIIDANSTNPAALRDAVKNSDVYAAIFVSPDASASYLTALGNNGVGYNGAAAITLVWDEARNNLATTPRVGGPLRGLIGGFCTRFATTALTGFVSSGGRPASSVPASLLTQPIYFTEENLFPFTVPAATQILLVGNILLVVFSLVATNVIFGPLKFHDMFKGMSVIQTIVRRLGLYLLYSGMVSIAYATILIGLATNNNTGGTFDGPVWARVFAAAWILHFIFALWLGILVCLAGGPEIGGVAMLPLIVFNVLSTNTDLADPGYKFFYYAPMWHVVELMRNALFGTLSSRIGMHVGVLFLWLVVELALFVWAHFKKAADAEKAKASGKPAPEGKGPVSAEPPASESGTVNPGRGAKACSDTESVPAEVVVAETSPA